MKVSNFDEFVELLAEEAPHALVLDSYRRLELTIRDYVGARQEPYVNGAKAENLLAEDSLWGCEIAAVIRELRLYRNRVAHNQLSIGPSQADAFARRSLDLIGELLVAQDILPNSKG